MINLYSPDDIARLSAGGEILAKILSQVISKVAPGVTTLELNQYAEDLITASHAKPSFKMEKGYHFATCLNVNETVVHGLPTTYKLRRGDILGVDIGLYYQGFHTDASWTVEVETQHQSKFLRVGQTALDLAIQKCFPGNHIGDISQTIQTTVEKSGYSCVKQLVGHGIGKLLHEDPEIPCHFRGNIIENTPIIKPGMVLAVEVIYNQGGSQVVYANNDGWTIVTKDNTPSGLFEHTVAVTDNGPKILTLASTG